jgi:hypothetical protein
MRGPWQGDHPQSAGWRYSSGNPHFAIDVAMPNATELYAIGQGRVVDANTGVTGNGYGQSGAPSNWVILEFTAPDGPHKGKTLTAYYQHLKTAKVKRGERVKKGQLIGLSDNTGNSSGPHLHLVVLKPGRSMNAGTRYAYLDNPDWVVWPIRDAWDDATYGPIDIYVGKLRPGVKDSKSVKFLRKCLISRGLLVPKKGLSETKPGNDYTAAVKEAVGLWQKRHDHTPDGTLNMAQAREFFTKNTRVRLHKP